MAGKGGVTPPQPLPPEALYRICDPAELQFDTTAELELVERPPGQQRALDAISLAASVRRPGFNLFVMGPPGADTLEITRRFLSGVARSEALPWDWCYLHNFEEPDRPRLLKLPPGQGQQWRGDLERLIDDMRTSIPATFESEEYQNRLQELQHQHNRRHRQAFERMQHEAERNSIALLNTPTGFAFAPMNEGGEVIPPDAFQQLPEDERKRFQQIIESLQNQLQELFQQFPQWQKEAQQAVRQLNEEMTLLAIGRPIEELRERYGELPIGVAHLDAVRDDLVGNFEVFRSGEREQIELLLHRYQANLLVHSEADESGAPVIYEDMPTHQRLVGRIEYLVHHGALITDFTQIRPGALHRANGGYLLVDVRKLLTQAFAWETLKRTLFAAEIRPESLEKTYGFWTTASPEPEPVPLNVKVILIGDRLLYYLLAAHDPDFADLFKVEADLEDDLPANAEARQLYARMVATIVAREALHPLDRAAVARVIEHAGRMAADSERLSARGRELADLMAEASHYAERDAAACVGVHHIEKTLQAQEYRASRVRERSRDMVRRGIQMIATEGDQVGSINGLSVLQLGDYAFGQPTRITATARPGRGQLVDIEREAKLGGRVHSKGVMILARFLGSRYAPDSELSLSASLAFEQSYGRIDGDSASVAELCALISAISRVPLRQGIAVTGSVNQHGEVQAVGGVNEKVEGFFEVCRTAGLDGTQAVALPAANVPHLMLHRDVRDAVAAGRFQLYPLKHVDDALALSTGMDPGARLEDGAWPEESLNRAVADRLAAFAVVHQRRSRSEEEPAGDDRAG
ncbi:ATP-binding protein [Aquisalimonas sp.]|uniref:Lon protease family protein n=1 Tax=Aquisalimonas sp. TaxID=1872621 RepID=UPI0025C20124|nr:ATP-binding protein [Aquisalimonas sp.]